MPAAPVVSEEADVACPFMIIYCQISATELAKMNRPMDWDDLHLVLAVFREARSPARRAS
jgi:hypothetical protein